MRSIPIAMTWEMLRHGRWSLPLGFIGANLIPVLILTALRFDGEIDPADPAMLSMQTILIQMHIFCFGAAILSALDFKPRARALPVSTNMLVACRMIPAMVLISLATWASIELLNLAYGLNWQSLGPMLLAPTAIAMTLAALSFTEGSALGPLAVCGVGVVIGLWHKLRMGPLFAFPTHTWNPVTPWEVLTLAGLIAVSCYFAIQGTARSRCGEKLKSLGILALLERLYEAVFERERVRTSPFRGAYEAQCWSESQLKVWPAPAITCVSLISWIVISVFFCRDFSSAAEGLMAGPVALWVAALLQGIIAGNLGSNDTTTEMGHFLATRPLTNRQLAWSLIVVETRSVLISWAIWAIPFSLIFGVAWTIGAMPSVVQHAYWWYVPATLVGLWVFVANIATMQMAGHPKLFLVATIAGLTVIIGTLLFSKLLEPQIQSRVIAMMLATLGIGSVGFTVWAMATARRKELLETSTAALCAGIWLALSVAVVLESFRYPALTMGVWLFVIGMAALAVAPLATTPLAVEWNRHR